MICVVVRLKCCLCYYSGKNKQEPNELDCGLHQTLISHGNGERINEKVNDMVKTMIIQKTTKILQMVVDKLK